MCGRSSFPSKLQIVSHYSCKIGPRASDSFKSESILLPGDDIPLVISNRNNERVVTRSQWGFGEYYNARVETIDEKNLWRQSYRSFRGVMPLKMFYEGGRWFESDEILSVAAIFRTMISSSGQRFTQCSMITTASVHPVDQFHERMPLIIEQEMIDPWLQKEDLNIKDYKPHIELEYHKTLA